MRKIRAYIKVLNIPIVSLSRTKLVSKGPFDEIQMHMLYTMYDNTGCGVFKRGVQKLERFLPKNQHTQRKFLNFENWVNGEVSKIGHHFSK